VGAASTDPVSWLGISPDADVVANAALGSPLGPVPGLGADPAGQGFGAIRFDAEVPNSDGINQQHDHSHYYAMGSESLRSMADIVSGHSGRLGAEGLLAPARHQPEVVTPDHIDLPFAGRVDVPQVHIPVPGAPNVIDPEWNRPGGTINDNHQYQ